MTDSILIVGGGLAGVTAATECANAGARAVVVERGPIIGGQMAAAMTDDSSVGEHVNGIPIPKLGAVAAQQNIEVITLAQLESIEGRPGNFDVAIRERARFVTDACTLCNHCRPVCPSVNPNEYDAGLTYRKAIYTPMPQTIPSEYVIDINTCLNKPPNYLPCNRCIEVCDDDAIHFDMALDRVHKKQVGALILAVGFEIADSGRLADFGYGVHPDVVTAAELQRLLVSPGPTGGFVSKPSNEEYPESILLILNELTPFSAYVAVSQIHQLLDQDIEKISLLVTAQQSATSQLDVLQSVSEETGIDVCWGSLNKIEPGSENRITVSYADFSSNRLPKEDYDMVVLSSEVRPAGGLIELAQTLGFDLADTGYVAGTANDGVVVSSRPGVYVAGCASGPRIVRETIEEARAAATAALGHLDPRLLRPDYAPAKQTQAAAEVKTASDDEMRARIESILYELIKKGD